MSDTRLPSYTAEQLAANYPTRNDPTILSGPYTPLYVAEQLISDGMRWIPTSERLPEPEVVGKEVALFVPVLFATRTGANSVCAGRFFPDKRRYRWRSLQGLEMLDVDVTHWMPLPEAPK